MPEIIVLFEDREKQRFVTDKEVITVGRGKSNDIVLDNLSASRSHARIMEEEGDFYLEDLGSSNGTELNGRKIQGREKLSHRDEILVGKHTLQFVDPAQVPLAGVNFDGDQTVMTGTPPPREAQSAPLAYLFSVGARRRTGALPIRVPVLRIGRGGDCELALADWFVDYEQACVQHQGEEYLLVDRAQTHPTLVNGEPIGGERLLEEGDVIQAGMTRILFTRRALDPAEAEGLLSAQPLRQLNGGNGHAAVAAGQLAGAEAGEEEAVSEAMPEAEALEADMPEEPTMGLDAAMSDGEEASAESEAGAPRFEFAAEEPDSEAEQEAVALEEEELDLSMEEDLPDDGIFAPLEQEASGEAGPEEAPEVVESVTAELASEPVVVEDEEQPMPEAEAEVPAQATQEEQEPAAEEAPANPRVALLEKALENPSPAVRKLAAKQLKQLTGKDYAC